MVAVLTDRSSITEACRAPGADLRLVGPGERCARHEPAGAATYRRRRIVVAGAVAAVALGLWIALQAALGGAGGGPLTAAGTSPGSMRPVVTHSWVVRPGDTLWTIAVALHPGGDVRPFVDRLSAETESRPLVAGQRLALP